MMKVLERIDSVILYLASKKEKVYVYYPIPTLPIHINKLIDQTYKKKLNLSEIKSSTLNWYLDDNRYIIEHFNNSEYPKNVYLLKPQEKLCDEKFCYAIKNNEPYYYDSNHPSSTFGAPKLVDLINIEN